MRPQSKVTIFMVVMIVMLSVYYFAIPKGNKDLNPGGEVTWEPYEGFVQMRSDVETDRQTMINQLYEIVAAETVSTDQKNEALSAIRSVHELTQNELLLEDQIRDAGFNDAFVKADQNVINVRVFCEDGQLSALEANDIMVMTKTQFGLTKEVTVTIVVPETN